MEDIHKEMIRRSLESKDGEIPQGLKDILNKIKNEIDKRRDDLNQED